METIDLMKTHGAHNDDASAIDTAFRILASSLGGAIVMMLIMLCMANI